MPSAMLMQTEIVLDLGGTFSVELPGYPFRPDVSLIIDIYDLIRPVHPEGHIGWWRYDPGQLEQRISGRLSYGTDGLLCPIIEGAAAVDGWRNQSPPETTVFELQVVLRSTITNAILSIDRIPVVSSDRMLKALRADFDRNYELPRYAPFHHLFPENRAVHIVSRDIFQRDAVGNLCLSLYRMLKQHRVSVNMYAESFDLTMNDVIGRRATLPYRVGENDIILYFFSTYDENLTNLLELKCRSKIAYFHGVTEPKLLQVFDPGLSTICAKAIKQIPLLAQFDRIAANSFTSAANLHQAFAGADCTAPDPISVLAPKIVGGLPSSLSVLEKDAIDTPIFLYVGRISAHKRIEDIIALLSEYRKLDPSARCVIVGRSDCQAYQDYLHWVQTKQLGLPADAVIWLGSVSEQKLTETYDTASIYVSMSEDEGYCLPLIEAMSRGTLVFAYDRPAVRETLGSTAVLFSEKAFEHLARQLHSLLADREMYDKIVETQYERARALTLNMDGREYLELLMMQN